MKQIIKLTIIGLFLLLPVLLFFVWAGIYFPRDASSTQSKLFLVEGGQGLFQISENLEKQSIIKNKFFFALYVTLKGGQTKLQIGEYSLSPAMNMPEIANKIISGDTEKIVITIPEGWNLRDIAWYFEGRGMFQAEELFELIGFPLIDYSQSSDLPLPKDFSTEFSFLEDKPNILSIEGYLFPDTYFIKEQRTINNEQAIEGIIRKMLENFDKKLTPELKLEIERQGKTIFETITMASLLEKEVRDFRERKIVAGILWKRLNSKIPLQVDATIAYITGKKTTKISREETKIDSPYNTYKYGGLPLGPICNPGIESIVSAIYPEGSEYWYYLSTLQGETIFSRTLEEHNIAKAKYLK